MGIVPGRHFHTARGVLEGTVRTRKYESLFIDYKRIAIVSKDTVRRRELQCSVTFLNT